MNIYQKLAEIRKMAAVVKKNKSGYGYKYPSEEEILVNITAGMNKYGISLVPRLVNGVNVTPYSYTKRKFAKDGTVLPDEIVNEILINGQLEFTWIDDDNPKDMVVVPWTVVGQQSDASQAFGSALTYCQRYFMLKYFQSATTEGDVDAYRSKQKENEEKEERETTKAIIDTVHASVTTFLTKYPDKKADITSLIKKHVIVDGKGSGDYYKVTKIDVANGLKEAITRFIAENSKVSAKKVEKTEPSDAEETKD